MGHSNCGKISDMSECISLYISVFYTDTTGINERNSSSNKDHLWLSVHAFFSELPYNQLLSYSYSTTSFVIICPSDLAKLYPVLLFPLIPSSVSKFGFEVEKCLWIFSGIIWSMDLGTWSRDLGTGSRDLGTGSRKREEGTGSSDLGARILKKGVASGSRNLSAGIWGQGSGIRDIRI